MRAARPEGRAWARAPRLAWLWLAVPKPEQAEKLAGNAVEPQQLVGAMPQPRTRGGWCGSPVATYYIPGQSLIRDTGTRRRCTACSWKRPCPLGRARALTTRHTAAHRGTAAGCLRHWDGALPATRATSRWERGHALGRTARLSERHKALPLNLKAERRVFQPRAARRRRVRRRMKAGTVKKGKRKLGRPSGRGGGGGGRACLVAVARIPLSVAGSSAPVDLRPGCSAATASRRPGQHDGSVRTVGPKPV